MHVLLFIKYPCPGQVKTRLAKDIGDEHARGLYRAFVRDELETIRRAGLEVTLCCAPNATLPAYRTWLGPQGNYTTQHGADLGERMANALAATLALTSPAVLIGGDVPDLPVESLVAAQNALNTEDICLGPSQDGGFYLLGVRAPQPWSRIFANVCWGTSQVLERTLDNCRALGICPRLVPTWSDVDTLADLGAFLRRGVKTCDATMAYVRAHNLEPLSAATPR